MDRESSPGVVAGRPRPLPAPVTIAPRSARLNMSSATGTSVPTCHRRRDRRATELNRLAARAADGAPAVRRPAGRPRAVRAEPQRQAQGRARAVRHHLRRLGYAREARASWDTFSMLQGDGAFTLAVPGEPADTARAGVRVHRGKRAAGDRADVRGGDATRGRGDRVVRPA